MAEMKPKIIMNTKGRTLELSTTRLTQVAGNKFPGLPRYLHLEDLHHGIGSKCICVFRVWDDEPCIVDVIARDRIIGCCKFSVKNWALILKAAGIKPAKKASKK